MPNKKYISVSAGHIVERVGDEVVVLTPETPEVLKLSGELAKIIHEASLLGGVEIPQGVDISHLVDCGVVQVSSGLSRRALLQAGAGGAGASLVALSLPSAAVASSTIQLSGKWFYVETGIGEGRQTFTVSSNFPSSGSPSALTIPNGTANYLGMDGEGDIANLYWGAPIDPFPNPNSYPVSGEDVIGTFTWPGTSLSYSVTFVYDPSRNTNLGG